MCGLVGIAGNLAFKDESTMQRLLLLDVFRGIHSTGMAAVRATGEVKLAKLGSHPLDFFELPKFKDALNGASSSAFIGHNRHATKGAVSTFNAHPFTFDHITGAHNGTLTNKSHKALEDALGEKFNVDSMALYAAIAKFGIEATIDMIETGTDSTTGAWSLTWFDQKEGTLNFLRNKHRPMWYAYTENFDRLIWASEHEFIDAATNMSTAGYSLHYNDKGKCYFSTVEDIHYKFDLSKLGFETAQPKPMAKELRAKEAKSGSGYAPFTTTGSGWPHHGSTGGSSTTPTSTTSTTPSKTSTGGQQTGSNRVLSLPRNPKTQPKDLITLIGDDEDPFAGMLDREKFEALAKFGCSYCGSTIEWGDTGVVVFERDDIIMCKCCHRAPDQNKLYTAGSVIDSLT